MKSNITSTVKAIAKGLIILICGVVAGTILLTSVYALPVERMHDHVEQAAELLVEEGAYPRLYGGQDIRMNPENFLDLKVMLLNTRGMARDNITEPPCEYCSLSRRRECTGTGNACRTSCL